MDGLWARLKAFDAHGKLNDELRVKTVTGGGGERQRDAWLPRRSKKHPPIALVHSDCVCIYHCFDHVHLSAGVVPVYGECGGAALQAHAGREGQGLAGACSSRVYS